MDVQPIPYATAARRGTSRPGDFAPAVIGWRTAAGAAWLVGILGGAAAAIVLFYTQQVAIQFQPTTPYGAVALAATWADDLAGPVLSAISVGCVWAAILYFSSLARLAWVAALPAVAACGSVLVISQFGFPTTRSAMLLFSVVAAQAGLIYAGTHLGRPLARWLTRQSVPPPLRASLVALWT